MERAALVDSRPGSLVKNLRRITMIGLTGVMKIGEI